MTRPAGRPGAGAALALSIALALASPARAAGAPEVDGLVAKGKLDEAVASGRAAVSRDPGDVELRFALAKALAAKGRRMERVVDVPGAPAELSGTSLKLTAADLRDARVVVGYDAALFEEALLHLGEGLRRAPARKDIRMLQCFLLTDGARIERASAALREAIETLPPEAGLAADLARFGAERTKRGDAAGGAVLLGIVAEAYPGNADVQADHGFSLARLGRKAEALAALDRAVAGRPKDAGLLRRRATAALLLRDYARAQSAYDAAFAVSRDDQDRFAAAVAAYGIDPGASSSLFRDLALPSPSAPPPMVELAAGFAAAAEAGAASKAALALAATTTRNRQELLAIPVYDRALAAEPKNAEARRGLAAAYRALGCPAIAAEIEKAP